MEYTFISDTGLGGFVIVFVLLCVEICLCFLIHTFCYIMLCYIMLCYIMLCYIMLCYIMLCYIMLCYIMFVSSSLLWFIIWF